MVQVSSDIENAALEDDELDEEMIEPFDINEDVMDVSMEDVGLINTWCPACNAKKPHSVLEDDDKHHIVVCTECNLEHEKEDGPHVRPQIHKSLLSDEDNASDEARRQCWIRMTQNISEDKIQKYNIHLSLKEGNVIRHSKFGLGIVCEDIGDGKVEILFEDGLRRLVCGR